MLNPTPYTAVGFSRKKVGKNQPGGGCAIIFNESKFFVNLADIFVPEGIEGIWRLATARDNSAKVGKIAIGSFYISPKSKFKDQTIEHIVEVIHCLRSQHEKMSLKNVLKYKESV